MQESINPNIDEFMAITGCDGHEAEYYLTEATHNLEVKITSFRKPYIVFLKTQPKPTKI